MSYLRPDGKVDVHIAARPDWAKALKEYAEYRHQTMTHVIIEAVSRRMKLAGYWPVETSEEKAERRRRAIAQKKAREAEKGKPHSRHDPSRNVKRSGAKPRHIGKGGRPIGKGPQPIGKEPRPIGQRRRSSNGGYTP